MQTHGGTCILHMSTHVPTHPLIRIGTGQLVLLVLLHPWCSAAVGWDWEEDHVNAALIYLDNARRLGVTTPSYVRKEDVRDLQCYESQLLLSYWTGMTANLYVNHVYPHPGSDHHFYASTGIPPYYQFRIAILAVMSECVLVMAVTCNTRWAEMLANFMMGIAVNTQRKDWHKFPGSTLQTCGP
jgi:hypothetical protein